VDLSKSKMSRRVVPVVLSVFAFIPNALATNFGAQCGYVPVVTGRSIDLQFSAGPAEWSASTSSPSGEVANMANMGSVMISNLQRGLSDELASEFRSIPEYDGHSVAVTGPLKFRFLGKGNPEKTAAGLMLEKIQLTANFSKSKHFLFFSTTVRCRVDVVINKPTFAGEYFMASGRMDLALARSTTSQSQSCSSSLGWVPWLGNKIESSAEKAIAEKAESLIGRLTDNMAYSLASRSFSSIAASIPLGRAVLYGVDYGLLFRQQLPLIVANQKTELDLYARSNLPVRPGTSSETLFSWRAPSSDIEVRIGESKRTDLVWRGSNYCREP